MALQTLKDERRGRLLELIRSSGFQSLPELSATLAVSESTIRRDLDLLEESGEAKRTHGGVFYTGSSPKLPHFELRQEADWERKQSIARRAADLVDDGDTLLLDGGSTTYELAQRLVGRPLQVVTNSLPVANLFASNANSDLVFLGGYLHSRTGVTLGPYANAMLAELNVTRAFLSVAGVSEEGFYNSNLLLVETEQAMMKAADEVTIVVDSSKFGHRSLACVCKLNEVNAMVVDSDITEDWRSCIVAAGVELFVAGATDNG